MISFNRKTLFCIGLIFLAVSSNLRAQDRSMMLWYNQPASEWMKALPLGNGRLGAMVYGGIQKETIALNEITFWSGKEDPNQEQKLGKQKLQEIRELFFNGNLSQGNDQCQKLMAGIPHSFGSHLPIGDLNLNFTYPEGKLQNYERNLDLENAIASVSYEKGGVKYAREYICSNPDGVLILHLTASKQAALNFSVSLNLLRQADLSLNDKVLEFSGDLSVQNPQNGGVAFLGNITVKTDDGTVSVDGKKLNIKNATSATLYIDIRTNFKSTDYQALCRNTIKQATSKDFEELRNHHVTDYQKLFKRVELFLGKSELDDLPTDMRWLQVKEGQNDVGLDALFFQYARYLLIASSRENSPLPANLQGIWNDNLANNMGWTCDYHLDINTQQNYWLANIGNLSECNTPLFSYIRDLSVYGQKTAKVLYGSKGWTAHTMDNVWGFTSPGWGIGWGLFPTGSTWIASHLWSHYCYTLDQNFLKNQAYPILKSNAQFFLDYMTIDPKTGYLLTGPSTSPENSFIYKGEGMSLSMMPTVDRVLVSELFSSVIQASKILKIDKQFSDSLQQALVKFPPLQISKRNGGLQEWLEDYEEASPNHRHTSHLLSLYPYHQVSLVKTPELAKAAEKTISNRLNAPGWEDVEWSRANMICYNARLKNQEEAYKSVVMLQRNFTRENLLTVSPKGIAGAPYDIFIFDGNEAGAAGIAEMLVQSQEGYIEFLPTLPEQWKTGYFKGLCVLNGGIVDLKWSNNKVEQAILKVTVSQIYKIKMMGTEMPVCTLNGKKILPKQSEKGFISFSLKSGDKVEMIY
ncbi:MAG TPA: glycoside hydrolase family 95 protein [Bacteroidales bacterium]|nr:glycoside hydrolase family 95 protein [Bacteroidales bacterium]